MMILFDCLLYSGLFAEWFAIVCRRNLRQFTVAWREFQWHTLNRPTRQLHCSIRCRMCVYSSLVNVRKRSAYRYYWNVNFVERCRCDYILTIVWAILCDAMMSSRLWWTCNVLDNVQTDVFKSYVRKRCSIRRNSETWT